MLPLRERIAERERILAEQTAETEIDNRSVHQLAAEEAVRAAEHEAGVEHRPLAEEEKRNKEARAAKATGVETGVSSPAASTAAAKNDSKGAKVVKGATGTPAADAPLPPTAKTAEQVAAAAGAGVNGSNVPDFVDKVAVGNVLAHGNAATSAAQGNGGDTSGNPFGA